MTVRGSQLIEIAFEPRKGWLEFMVRNRVMVGSAIVVALAGGVRADAPGAKGDSPVVDRTCETGPRYLCKEVRIRAPIAEVWRAWTDSRETSKFFGEESKIELRVGGAYEIYFSKTAPAGERGSEGCRVLSYLPMRMLSFEWNAPPKFQIVRRERTCVVIEFVELGPDEVLVRLTQHGWKTGREWDETFAYFRVAWHRVLENLHAMYSSAATTDGSNGLPRYFICYLEPVRPTLAEDASETEREMICKHAAYLEGLTEKGVVLLAGRQADGKLGLLVLAASDRSSAERLISQDPARAAGLFRTRVEPFRLAMMRGM